MGDQLVDIADGAQYPVHMLDAAFRLLVLGDGTLGGIKYHRMPAVTRGTFPDRSRKLEDFLFISFLFYFFSESVSFYYPFCAVMRIMSTRFLFVSVDNLPVA